jgi:DNA-binding MarR family transcriptional regulator
MRTRDQKVLWRLSREPAYVAEIIRDTEVGPHGVAEAVRALQTRGYATRVEGDPGQWTITADGREALRAERSWMERTVCPACLRIRGPIHWVVRLAGFCP